MDAMKTWFWISSIFLATLLFRPIKKLIFTQRVRRAIRQLKRDLTEEELKNLEKRTIPMTALITVTFSLMFNSVVMSKFFK
ncbi:MAG: hypothetical protein ISR96_01395 [Nitrospira sp.]|nr:hypothetical protein [bacterium]MBL7048169.1 hypothetical protein [Nitrospira sp.]